MYSAPGTDRLRRNKISQDRWKRLVMAFQEPDLVHAIPYLCSGEHFSSLDVHAGCANLVKLLLVLPVEHTTCSCLSTE